LSKSCEIDSNGWRDKKGRHALTSKTCVFHKRLFSNFNKKSCLIYTLCHLHDLFRSQLSWARVLSDEREGEGEGGISVWERDRDT
jgi:hypothetical protein